MLDRSVIFFIVWAVIVIFYIVAFGKNRNVELKRKLLPIFSVGMIVLPLIMLYLMVNKISPSVIIVTIFIVSSGILYYKGIMICESCGSTIARYSLFSKDKYCRKCGAKINNNCR
jgi:hypothetical protein